MDKLSIILLALLIVVALVALLGWGYYAVERQSRQHFQNELTHAEAAGDHCHHLHIQASADLEDAHKAIETVITGYDVELKRSYDMLEMVLNSKLQNGVNFQQHIHAPNTPTPIPVWMRELKATQGVQPS